LRNPEPYVPWDLRNPREERPSHAYLRA